MNSVSLIPATEADFEFYFRLKCEESNVYWGGHRSPPAHEVLWTWYSVNVLDKKLIMYIVQAKEESVGVVYYRMLDEYTCEYLGLGVLEASRGTGVAKSAVIEFIRIVKKENPLCIRVLARIREDNQASIALHKNIGFVEDPMADPVWQKSSKGDSSILMKMWVKRL